LVISASSSIIRIGMVLTIVFMVMVMVMVVIAYYYYAESASAELLAPTRGSVWFLLGVIATVLQESNVLCVRPSRRYVGSFS
jgi:hypothetical protein